MWSRVGKALAFMALGAMVGWLFGSSRAVHYYRATEPLEYVTNGPDQGTIPAGAPILSVHKLTDSADFGWWGCFPVTFDTAWVARRSGIRDADRFEYLDVPMRATFDYLQGQGASGSR